MLTRRSTSLTRDVLQRHCYSMLLSFLETLLLRKQKSNTNLNNGLHSDI